LQEKKKVLSSIEELPLEMIDGIANFLSTEDLSNLSKTSQTMFSISKDSLKKRAVKPLLSYVVEGNEEEALKLIESYPSLLIEYSKITNYPGITSEKITPFQAALILHDITMLEKMLPYFNKLVDGRAVMARQFKEIFPQDIFNQKPYDFSKVMRAIDNSSEEDLDVQINTPSNTESDLGKSLNEYKQQFTDLSKKEGYFYPPHLVAAIDACNYKFAFWTSEKLKVTRFQVLGFAQRFAPVSYARYFITSNTKKPAHEILKYYRELNLTCTELNNPSSQILAP
jgi:hypothetical protein